MSKTPDLDPGSLPESTRTALEAAAEARALLLKAGQDVIRANTARAIEERIRERLTGETMLRPDPAFSRYIDQRGREIAGLAPAKTEDTMVEPDENGLEPEGDEEIEGSA